MHYNKNNSNLKDTLSQTGKWLLKHAITVFACVAIVGLGITILTYASPGTTTIGEDITTTNLKVSDNATTSGNQTVSGNLDVSGTTTLTNASTSGFLNVGGVANFLSNISVSGTTSLATTTVNKNLQVIGTTSLATTSLSGNLEVKGPKPWIDIRAYGAVGDGTTDDTQAFIDAFNKVRNIGHGTIYIPSGTYLVKQSPNEFQGTNGVAIIGDGASNTEIKLATDYNWISPNGKTHGFIQFTLNSELVHIKGIKINGQKTDYGNININGIINVSYTYRGILLQNVTVRGAYGNDITGVYMGMSSGGRTTFENVRATYVDVGFTFDRSSSIAIESSYFGNTNKTPVKINQSSEITIESSLIDESSSGSGIYISGGTSRMSIDNSVLYGNPGYGVEVADGEYITISNSSIRPYSTSDGGGLKVAASGTVAIYHNYIAKYGASNEAVLNNGTVYDMGGNYLYDLGNSTEIDSVAGSGTTITDVYMTVYRPDDTQNIATSTATVSVDHTYTELSADASYTLKSTPTISDGTKGQEVKITEVGSGSVTFQDEGTLAGSNLQLSTSTRTVDANDLLHLIFNGNYWIEAGYSNN